METADSLIRAYYACFNERRFRDLQNLFTEDAAFEQSPFRGSEPGRIERISFANAWLTAFPDAVLTIERVTPRDPVYEVNLVASGTHQGALDLGGWIFHPTGIAATLRLRELIELREGRIAFSSVSFDLQAIVERLAQVDSAKVLDALARIRRLGDELARVQRSPIPARDVIEQLGRELDAARHTVRPYFKR